MSFMPQARNKLLPGIGDPDSRIAIVGDYTDNYSVLAGRPFGGPSGSVLEACLHAAGLIRGEVFLTSCFRERTSLNGKMANMDFFNEQKKQFTAKGEQHAAMLREELNHLQANVIVTCGLAPLMAVSSLKSSAKMRGYVCQADKLKGERKLIPTHSPGAAVRGNYTFRHIITSDLSKAKRESEYPEIIRPFRNIIYQYANVEELLQWMEYLSTGEVLCFDIEVINYEVSCFSFAISPDTAVVVPIGETTFHPQGWDEFEELLIWRYVQKLLGNPNTVKVAQNSIFDIHFILSRNGVVVRGPVHDTMVAHSVMFPELPKGLDFLGSIYCGSQEYWKDAVNFDNIKGES